MHYVYLISSKVKKWNYIGCTSNLRERFADHNAGEVKSTKAHKPFDLLYYEAYKNLSLARKREFELKNHSQQKEFLYKRLNLM